MDENPVQLTPEEMKWAFIKAGIIRKPVAKWVYIVITLMHIYAPFANDPDYIEMLRFSICGGCGYLAYKYTYKNKSKNIGTDIEDGWFWVMVGLAIRSNPLIPLYNYSWVSALIDFGSAAFVMLALRRDHGA